MKVLIMGLPGSGKSSLTTKLVEKLNAMGQQVRWHNADSVRSMFDDWDFSDDGRTRQAVRMGNYGTEDKQGGFISLCEFVCPTNKLRDVFSHKGEPDYIIWLDTIREGRFEDTNKLFEPPKTYDYRIRSFNSEHWATKIAEDIVASRKPIVFDSRKPTVQMLGRWQPWHPGHQALFERAFAKTGQVCIMVRDCKDWNDSNPFDVTDVERRIHQSLEVEFYGRYIVMVVPNIVNITYGRDVGYKIEQEVFDEKIHAISATKIREEMGY